MSVSKGHVAMICLVVFCSLPVFSAEEEASNTVAQFENNEQIENAEPSWFLSSHETVSKTIGNWSTNIDSFLSGTHNRQPSDSYLEVRFGTVLSESDRSGFFDFRTRLKLPNTQNRLRLVIESEPDSLAPEV